MRRRSPRSRLPKASFPAAGARRHRTKPQISAISASKSGGDPKRPSPHAPLAASRPYPRSSRACGSARSPAFARLFRPVALSRLRLPRPRPLALIPRPRALAHAPAYACPPAPPVCACTRVRPSSRFRSRLPDAPLARACFASHPCLPRAPPVLARARIPAPPLVPPARPRPPRPRPSSRSCLLRVSARACPAPRISRVLARAPASPAPAPVRKRKGPVLANGAPPRVRRHGVRRGWRVGR